MVCIYYLYYSAWVSTRIGVREHQILEVLINNSLIHDLSYSQEAAPW